MKRASCEVTHVHYVSVSAGLWLEYIKGLGFKVQLHPRLMTPQTGWPLGGLTAGGGGYIYWTDQGEKRGWGKIELKEVKFRTEGRKIRTKGYLKRKSAGGEMEVFTMVDLEYILVVFDDLFCCSLPWFWCLALVWSSELTPDPGFWPYPLHPATPSRLANMCYQA